MKFSELTLDMFRMLQTLEREPQEDLTTQLFDTSPAPGRPPFVSAPTAGTVKCSNKNLVLNPPSKIMTMKGNSKINHGPEGRT